MKCRRACPAGTRRSTCVWIVAAILALAALGVLACFMGNPADQQAEEAAEDTAHPFSDNGWIDQVFETEDGLYCLKALGADLAAGRGLYRLEPEAETGTLVCCLYGYDAVYENGCLYYANYETKTEIMEYHIATGQLRVLAVVPECDRAAVGMAAGQNLIVASLWCDALDIVQRRQYSTLGLDGTLGSQLWKAQENGTFLFVGASDDSVVYIDLSDHRLYVQALLSDQRVLLEDVYAGGFGRACLVYGGACYYPSETGLVRRMDLSEPGQGEDLGERPGSGQAISIKVFQDTVYVLWGFLRSAAVYRLSADGNAVLLTQLAEAEDAEAGLVRDFCVCKDGVVFVKRDKYAWVPLVN